MKATRNPKGITVIGGILLALLAVLIGTGLALYGYANSLRSQDVSWSTQLNAQYLSNQNYLSNYVSGFYEQLGLVKYKSEKLDQVLLDYAKSRGEKGSVGQAFLVAVVEAVPDLKGLNIADKMLAYVQAGREGYRATQDKLLDMLKGYDAWRQDGYVQSWIIANVIGAPSDRLEARIGTTVYRGKEARDKMYTIVLTSDTKKAYESGTMEPLKVK